MSSGKPISEKTTNRIVRLLIGISLIVAGPSASAQVTAAVSGKVTDVSRAVVPGVTVTSTNLETGTTRAVLTDASGSYRLLALTVGRYEVKAELTGFKPEARQAILTVGQEFVINFELSPGAVTQEVAVTGEMPLVNVTTTQIAGLVGEREMRDLPLNGRSFDNLITLNPGTVNITSQKSTRAGGLGNNFSVSGRRSQQNMFLLNGIEYIGADNGFGSVPGGASGQLLGIDAIREFNVVKDTYSAEYGKRVGAQVSIVTLAGTNEFHGNVFDFLRNSALDARNFFDKGEVPPFRRNNFGFSTGGPLKKDKLFIFGNYEGFRHRLGLSRLAIVPDENARRGFLPDPANPGRLINVGLASGVEPYFALWPAPDGRNFGDGRAESFSNPKEALNEDFFTVRVDHTFTQRDTLNGVYTFDQGDSVTPIDNPLSGRLFTSRNQLLTVEETHTFSSSILNTFRFGLSRGRTLIDNQALIDFPENLSVVPGLPMANVTVTGLSNAGAADLLHGQDVQRTLLTFTDALQVSKGRHWVSLGVWFQQIRHDTFPASRRYGLVTFASLRSLMQGTPASVVVTLKPIWVRWRSLEGAWYVQDTIQLRSNLTLNVGLRHEFTNGWNEAQGNAWNFIPNPATGVLLTEPRIGDSLFTKNNAKWLLGPRVGLAWDPFGRGQTVVHTGFGLYYNLLDQVGSCCHYLGVQPVNLQNPTFPVRITSSPLTQQGNLVAPAGIQPDAKTPSAIKYNVRIEQKLPGALAVSAEYVGSRGYHDILSVTENLPVPTTLPDGGKFFPANAPRRNPELDNGSIFHTFVRSDYHGLLLDITRRFGNGLQLRANYTWSKSIDNGSAYYAADSIQSPGGLMDPDDPRRDRGLSNFSVSHRFSMNGTFQLPFGRGRAFLGDVHGVRDALISGWDLSLIVNLQSGLPVTPFVGFNRSRSRRTLTAGGDRPDLRAGVSREDIILGKREQWFDPMAFLLPDAGTYGNAGRNILFGPGEATADLSLVKMTQISERIRLQFRAEAFNVLNRTNFNIPDLRVFNTDGTTNRSVGLVAATTTTSRQLQLGLKLLW